MVLQNKNIVLELEPPNGDDLMLKVALERPDPQGVKMSRKNIAMITISPEEEDDASH